MSSIEEELDAALLAVAILKAENARYREALEFYANKTNYSYYCYEYNLKTCGDDELGSHAREALKEIGE